MKKLFWIILFVSLFSATEKTNAQLRKVPAKVTTTMQAWYPEAKNVEWRDKLTCYQANFYLDGVRYEARFSKKGHWKRTEAYISEKGLPSTVKEGLRKSKYRNWDVRSSYVIYKPEKKQRYQRYHVRVAKSGWRQKELVFTVQGQSVKDKMAI